MRRPAAKGTLPARVGQEADGARASMAGSWRSRAVLGLAAGLVVALGACGNDRRYAGQPLDLDGRVYGAGGYYGDEDASAGQRPPWDSLAGPGSGKLLDPDGGASTGAAATALPCGGSTPNTAGLCCPVGQGYDAKAQACVGSALVECPDLAQCRPRWCADWTDSAAKPCAPGAAGCSPTPRVCATQELADSACRAGQFPSASGCLEVGTQTKMPGGYAWIADTPLPALPVAAQAAPPDLRPAPLPAPATATLPTWCLGGGDQVVSPCAVAGACLVGQVEAAVGLCQDVSAVLPPWCPAGFVADAASPPECAPTADECGGDAFGGIPQEGVNLFVDATFVGQSQGTRAAPFVTLSAALKAAKPGATIALAAGAYPLDAAANLIPAGVTVQGRCAKLVTITALESGTGSWLEVWGKLQGATVLGATAQGALIPLSIHDKGTLLRVLAKGGAYATIRSFGGTLQDVVVQPSQRGVLLDQPGTSTEISGLRISKAVERGLVVAGGAQVKATAVSVTGTQAGAPGTGQGLLIAEKAHLTVVGLRLTGNHVAGLAAYDLGSEATATRVWIADTQVQAGDNVGHGVTVSGGAQLHLRHAVLTGNREIGALAWGSGSALRAENMKVINTLPDPTGTLGEALRAQNGATVRVRGLWANKNCTRSVFCVGSTSVLDLSGAAIVGTLPQLSSQNLGNGIRLEGGCVAQLNDVRIDGSHHKGLSAAGVGTSVTGSNLTVTNTLSQASDGKLGFGAEVVDGAQLQISGARLFANQAAGLWVADAGTLADVTGLSVDHTLPQTDASWAGRGVQVSGGATLHAWGPLRIEANRDFGVLADGLGTHVTLGSPNAGAVIAHTAPRGGDGWSGRGVQAQAGAAVKLTYASIADNSEAGVVATGAGTTLQMANVWVTATTARAVDGQFGRGVVVENAADAQFSQLTAAGNGDVGVMAAGAKLHGEDLLVFATLSTPQAGPGSGGERGRGLVVQGGADVGLARVRLSANRDVGLSVAGLSTLLQVEDLVIDGTQPQLAGQLAGRGVDISGGAQVWLRRASLTDNHEVGLMIQGDGTKLEALDLHVANTQAAIGGGHFGRGIVAADHAQINVTGGIVSKNRDIGLAVEQAAVSLVGTVVSATAKDGAGWGAGVSLAHKSTLLAYGLACAGNSGAALFVSDSTASLQRTSLVGSLLSAIAGSPTQVGDGLMAVEGADIQAVACAAVNNTRAGFLASGASLQVQGVVTTGNNLGWVLQNSAKLGGTGAIANLNVTNVWTGAALSVWSPPGQLAARLQVPTMTF